ncbi:MAG: GNAT family N-acetyltransferase [Desulfobacula sp.]|nr:GNAT family N-acetyltransferase [Desulfobacula sp.]
MDFEIRSCLKIDFDKLQSISYETYDETFRPMNSQDTMDKYLEKSFNKNKLQAELNDTNCQFYFLYLHDDLAGYLKINEAQAQTDINDPKSIELERIYIKKAFKGRGLGGELMNYALQLAGDMTKDYLWLGVWEKNLNAISFYKKMGFSEAGQHSFKMGDELQNDLIMKKTIKNI